MASRGLVENERNAKREGRENKGKTAFPKIVGPESCIWGIRARRKVSVDAVSTFQSKGSARGRACKWMRSWCIHSLRVSQIDSSQLDVKRVGQHDKMPGRRAGDEQADGEHSEEGKMMQQRYEGNKSVSRSIDRGFVRWPREDEQGGDREHQIQSAPASATQQHRSELCYLPVSCCLPLCVCARPLCSTVACTRAGLRCPLLLQC